jgi:hypothetical protein
MLNKRVAAVIPLAAFLAAASLLSSCADTEPRSGGGGLRIRPTCFPGKGRFS